MAVSPQFLGVMSQPCTLHMRVSWLRQFFSASRKSASYALSSQPAMFYLIFVACHRRFDVKSEPHLSVPQQNRSLELRWRTDIADLWFLRCRRQYHFGYSNNYSTIEGTGM